MWHAFVVVWEQEANVKLLFAEPMDTWEDVAWLHIYIYMGMDVSHARSILSMAVVATK